MSDFNNHSDFDDEIFQVSTDESTSNNQRIAIRYIRNDITVLLSYSALLRPKQTLPVKLLNISSKGVLVECKKKLSIKKNVTLTLKFNDNKTFVINSKVVFYQANTQCGLQFDHLYNELGEHLLNSQNDLLFQGTL